MAAVAASTAIAMDNHHSHNNHNHSQHDPSSALQSPLVEAGAVMLEHRPFRRFQSSEEYLFAMKEDLAEWLHSLYDLDINADNFCDALETGVALCHHANAVRRRALERRRSGAATVNGLFDQVPVPAREVTYRGDVAPGTFLARDNVSNFIAWCRGLGIYECLLFETGDLVERKNEKSFILCLLEVARRGSKLGMPAPLLVQMEEEIDREIAADNERKKARAAAMAAAATTATEGGNEGSEEEEEESGEPPPQIITNDLKSLDEMVRDLVNRCTCPVQFPMMRVSEGKYRIGDTHMLIFVRILRSHVMVRVGGGWDTLEHYLDKHDPCRCRMGHRLTVGSKLSIQNRSPSNPAQTQMQVTYERSPEPFRAGSVPPKTSNLSIPPGSPQRARRASLTSKSSTGSLASNGSSEKERPQTATSGSSVSPAPPTRPNDDKATDHRGSTEQVDEGYQSGSRGPVVKTRRYSGNRLLKLLENGLNEADPSAAAIVQNGSSKVDADDPTPPITVTECKAKHHDQHDAPPPRQQQQQQQRKGSISNIPKATKSSRIPYLDDGWHGAGGALGHNKSQSTENLGDKLHPIQPSSSAYNLNKSRRYSGDAAASAGKPPSMTRSRSQCSEDSDMASYLQRRVPGRNSYRTPGSRIPRVSPSNSGGNNTWSCRQKESRPSLTADLFSHPPPKPLSKSPSPQRRLNNTTRSPPPPPLNNRPRANTTPPQRSLQSSPNKALSPMLQEVLAAASSDEQLLRKMEEIVQQYKGRIEGGRAEREEMLPQPPQPPTEELPGENYTKYWVATTAAATTNGNGDPKRHRHSSGTSHSIGSPEDSGSDVAAEPKGAWSRENSNLGNDEPLRGGAPENGSRIPVPARISPRKDSLPGQTRIPMPTFYSS